MEDHYTVLGVARNASAEQIQRAHRKLAKRYHPDLNPGKPQAAERFKAITAAYALLSDPDKRARYDRGEIDATGVESARSYASYRTAAEGAQRARYGGRADEAWFRSEGLKRSLPGHVRRGERRARRRRRDQAARR